MGRRDPNNVWALVRPWLQANDGGKVLQAEGRPWLADPGGNIVLNTNIACHKKAKEKYCIAWKILRGKEILFGEKYCMEKKYCIKEKYCMVSKGQQEILY